jgi:hypothetical protein
MAKVDIAARLHAHVAAPEASSGTDRQSTMPKSSRPALKLLAHP